MTLERVILTIIYVISLVLWVWILPRSKWRELCVALLACQALTWINSLIHVQWGLYIFPVREFPKATNLSFTLEFFLYPFLCAISFIYEPKDSRLKQLCRIALWVSIAVAVDVLLNQYTNLVHYIRYTWYCAWVELYVIYWISNTYTRWFFKGMRSDTGGESAYG
ncbi:CBO0543 family protein [Paenibacillus hexagrammi]|uniref:Uncharacterized protein n=1 Tax=Paenibacillus hexagrammi TaxID=2908839 RepID=A0ABY3SHY4_9BACL|nr:CBO0543 family protein [Paenibacillus sp. YPD9-1]UJF33512.1 hypothetical protein L0M14_29110 [Paenibacillus sp. YPD9-1]